MVTRKPLRDRTILVAKCLVVREAIWMAIQKGIQRFVIKIDSQLVVNSINEKIEVLKEGSNLVEDIKCLLSHFSVSKVEYYNKITNRMTDHVSQKGSYVLN